MSYDILQHASQDLLDPETQAGVIMLIESGMVLGLGAAPVCSSMSRAITPSWRSAAEPYGIQGLTETQQRKVDDGKVFAKFVSRVCFFCLDKGIPFLGRELGHFVHLVHP